MRNIGIMIGSDSDLPQCLKGLEYLKDAERRGLVNVVAVITNSIHRNTEETLNNTSLYTKHMGVEVWIVGAGWANHLTGVVDSYLRYNLRNDSVPVIGVAFDAKDEERNLAAILSITQVPETQVVFDEELFGEEGFFLACKIAVEGELPEIVLKDAKPEEIRTLDEAITESIKKKGAKS